MTREKGHVPDAHRGALYSEVLGRLSQATGVRRYMEVGVSSGDTFSRIVCNDAIGVDPAFRIEANVAANKRRVSLFGMTSDAFFSRMRPRRILRGPADLVFLDGMHLFEFLLRDFMNAEAVCTRDSIIALHDCLPLNAIMAERDVENALRGSVGTPFHDWWTGDVWKLIPILRRYRPDLEIMPVDAYPTGLVFVTGLDPGSRVLKRVYSSIVRAYTADTDFNIHDFYGSMAITSAAKAVDVLSRRSFSKAGKAARLCEKLKFGLLRKATQENR